LKKFCSAITIQSYPEQNSCTGGDNQTRQAGNPGNKLFPGSRYPDLIGIESGKQASVREVISGLERQGIRESKFCPDRGSRIFRTGSINREQSCLPPQ
jgi:hypothetical protein